MDPLANLPTIAELMGIFPITVWSVGLVSLGYYVGRRSCREFIDYLKEKRDGRTDR